MESNRRAFLGSVGIGVLGSRFVRAQSAAPAQLPAPVPVRRIKSTVLFKSPEGYPNAIAVAPDGLWIAEQKTDNAHLVDWNGKVLKTVKTESKNTSGMGFGDGCIWMAANADPQGVFQTDMNSRTISHRQIPLGPSRERRRLPRCGIRQRQALDRRASVARHPPRRCEDVGTRVPDPLCRSPRARRRRRSERGLDGDRQRAGGRANQSTTPKPAARWRPRSSTRAIRTRTGSPCTTARSTAAMREFIPAGRKTRARHTATFSGSICSDAIASGRGGASSARYPGTDTCGNRVSRVRSVAATSGRQALSAWRAVDCQRGFERRAGIWRFLTAPRREELEPFMQQDRIIRQHDGRRISIPNYYRRLPFVRDEDPHAGQWRLRRETYHNLLAHVFHGDKPWLRVLDVGAGSGWLSHRLTALGHGAVAVDAVDDDTDGLGAAQDYATRFVVVQADFEALPFAPRQFDVAVFNGSLHYAPDPAATIERAHRLLVPGATVVVMDSPMFRREQDGSAMVDDNTRRFMDACGLAAVVQPGPWFSYLREACRSRRPAGSATAVHPIARPNQMARATHRLEGPAGAGARCIRSVDGPLSFVGRRLRPST